MSSLPSQTIVTANVPPLKSPERLDLYLAEVLNISRTKVQRLCKEGNVSFKESNSILKPSLILNGGETLIVTIPPEPLLSLLPEVIPLDIVYEDESLIVINKPKGLVVHPGGGSRSGTLVNALLAHTETLSGLNTLLRPGIVHRLDKDTSGLIVVAKTNQAHEELAKQISARTVMREYWAIVEGHLTHKEGSVNQPIGRDPKNRKRMAIVLSGRKAITHYKVLEEFPGFSLLSLRLETGRTHQIRVHLKYLRHPVVGDAVYGKGTNPFGIAGQALHAKTLRFLHPVTKKMCEFTALLPNDFARALETLHRNKTTQNESMKQ